MGTKGSTLLSNALHRVAALPVWAKILLALAVLVVVLGVAILLSPFVMVLALVVLIVAILGLIVRLLMGRPLRGWGLLAATSLVVLVVFHGISNALYFNWEPEQASPPEPQKATEKPTAKPEPLEQAEKTEGARDDQQQGEQPSQEVKKEEASSGVEQLTSNGADEENSDAASSATVQISRVVDGDTIEIAPAVDGKDTVRLIGIDAPEAKSQECGAQPLAQEAAWSAAVWEGLKVKLEFDQARTDQYGRLLAYVHNPRIGQMMNVDMIDSGYAQVYIVPPNTTHEDELRKAQKEAKELSLGFGLDIWSLPPAKEAQLADHGNGIGQGDGACPPLAQSTTTATATATATANSSPNRDYNDPNAPNPNAPATAPSTASPAATAPSTVSPAAGGSYCEPPAHPVPPGTDGDGDGDGCAGEE